MGISIRDRDSIQVKTETSLFFAVKFIHLPLKIEILEIYSLILGIINMKGLGRARKEEEVLAEYERIELGYINRENSCLNESAYIIDFIMSKRKSDAK